MASVATLLLSFASAGAARPGWVQPKEGVRFAARDVVADHASPLPNAHEAFYVFTRRALTRPEIRTASAAGLRYLGVVAEKAYLFRRERAGSNQRALLGSDENVVGTAFAEPIDRLESEVVPYLGTFGNRALPHPLWVAFAPYTTRAELLALIPEAGESLRLPRGGDAPVREEALVKLARARSTGATLDRLAASPLVAAIGFVYPKVELNAASRALSNADAIIAAPYNLDGTGILVGHWDGGAVSATHPDFQGRVTNIENGDVIDHATHTAGTILGAGLGDPSARGYAIGATMIAYDFYGDPNAERREAKHQYYHWHDNHSWGSSSTNFGTYDDVAREFDLDSRDLFLVALKAAGNEGQQSQVVDNNYGFDSLSTDSTGKNILIICATDDDGDLASFSSRGPTDDGRIKPDFCANGVNLNSTLPGGGYGNLSGTSMATPSVTGMVTLLAQLYQRENHHRWAPDLLSAIMIHNVTDVFHVGPDYRFGWGNADAKAAADFILADAADPGRRLIRGAARDGETVEYPMDVPAGAPSLKVTLTWLDAFAAGTAQRRLINDLDLELLAPNGETEYPWTLDPANPFADAARDRPNDVDTVEQVVVDAPQAGVWTVRVRGTSVTDPDLDVQGFVLATSHAVDRPVERYSATIPSGGLLVPDGDASGLPLSFEVTDLRNAKSLRFSLELSHEARGDIRIEMVHPDGTTAVLEEEDQSTRRDIYAVFPDTRSYVDDVTAMYGKPATGTWVVRVIDTAAGSTGRVLDAMLEIDFDGRVAPPVNVPPVANAGKDQEVGGGDTVALDGSQSLDPDGDALTYAWTQVTGPSVTLTGVDQPTASFVAPSSPDTQTMIFRLTVDDGRGGSSSDDVLITILGDDPGMKPNEPPVAVTNGDQSVTSGSIVALDASASSDPDGDRLTFSWAQTAGVSLQLDDPGTSVARFTAPVVSAPLELRFRVQVEDGRGGIALDDVAITVMPDPGSQMPEQPMKPGQTMGTGEGRMIGGGCGCTTHTRTSSGTPFALLLLGLLLFRRRR